MPVVEVEEPYTPSTFNDPDLTQRIAGVFREQFGEDRVQEAPPVMGGEDFSQFGRTPEERGRFAVVVVGRGKFTSDQVALGRGIDTAGFGCCSAEFLKKRGCLRQLVGHDESASQRQTWCDERIPFGDLPQQRQGFVGLAEAGMQGHDALKQDAA
ncbi:MAG: M20/M25/M40 family metallo-hydrolase [Candidatus Poseidoniia archaeon]